MTPQQRKEISRYLKAFDFSGLFTDPVIGRDWPDSGKPLRVPFRDGFLDLAPVAGKKGVRILLMPPLPDGGIMPSDERKKLDKAVTPLAAEHLLIFADRVKKRQVWLWTSRLPGKPVFPTSMAASSPSGQDARAPLMGGTPVFRYQFPAISRIINRTKHHAR